MLRIKPAYNSKTVQINGTRGKIMFDCSKNYSQDQLLKMSKTEGFKNYIEEVGGSQKEVNLKDIKQEEVKPKKVYDEFPTIPYDELSTMSLPVLRETYPFVKAKSRDSFIEQLLELNYGNPAVDK